jgi:DegV family protein with EDD domain
MKIVSDSASNITMLEGIDFESVSIRVLTDLKEYVDDSEAGVAQMVEELSVYKGKSRTSCPAPGDYIEAFGGEDEVFVTTITSGLSGSYNSAMVAKQQYEDENPGKKVFVIDSLSAGPEIGLIIYKLRELILAGKDFATISEEIMEYKKKTMLSFSLENIANLANNGRVSPTIAKIVGFVGIRLVGRASIEGTLEQTDKSRGEKRALTTILSNMKKFGYNGGKVIIDHCQNLNAAKELKALLHGEFPGADILIGTNKALCSFYAEKGGVLVGYEVKDYKPA